MYVLFIKQNFEVKQVFISVRQKSAQNILKCGILRNKNAERGFKSFGVLLCAALYVRGSHLCVARYPKGRCKDIYCF